MVDNNGKSWPNPTVLFLFNSSLYAPMPWLESGRFNCVSVDWEETDHSDQHVRDRGLPIYGSQGRIEGATSMAGHSHHWRLNVDLNHGKDSVARVLHLLDQCGLKPPSLVVSFAPCTDLAVSGAAHFARKREKDPLFQVRATVAARIAQLFDCAYCVENPVSVLSTLWRKPDAIWHPWEYAGHCPEGPHPEFPDHVPEQDRYTKKTCNWSGNGFIHPTKRPMEPFSKVNPGHKKLGGKSAKTKYIRSLTPRGWAYAVYEANAPYVLIDGQKRG